MTADVISVGLDDNADHCMQMVTEQRIRHLPVLRRRAVIGVVSIGDLVKAVIEDQQVELRSVAAVYRELTRRRRPSLYFA